MPPSALWNLPILSFTNSSTVKNFAAVLPKNEIADIMKNVKVACIGQITANTAKELDYNPKLLVAQNAGYTDPKFIATMGSKAEGVITRSPFNTDLATTIPMIGTVNELFKTHSGGRDLSDVPARAFTGFMALANDPTTGGPNDPRTAKKLENYYNELNSKYGPVLKKLPKVNL